jgi:starch-binding outer membrane protein, SusD/RagB family
MKDIKIYFAASLLLLAGCDDFLSKEPDNRTKIDNAEKLSELLVSAYPEANYMTFCEAMTDNVSPHLGGTANNVNQDPYFYLEPTQTEQDSPEYYWAACYNAIAAANQALESIASMPNPEDFNAQKGEALVARAYAHFMLVNLFAKFYDPETAGSDMGIPYVTEVEKVALKTYERKTVQYVYDMVEKDMLEGIPLIRDEMYTVPSYHFTRAAAHAFAVRYYLFKKDYNAVIDHANEVFGDGDVATRLRPWNTTYQQLPFDELAATYTKSSEKANLLLCETSSLWARSYYNYRYSTGVEELDGIRSIEEITGGNLAYTVYSLTSINIYFVVKFREHFVKEDISSTTGLPYTIAPLFTTEEVLLSRAEAYAYTRGYTKAIADLNSFISTRIVDYDPALHNLTTSRINNFWGAPASNTDRAIALTALYFRRAEFLHEGLWWFDILRYQIDVVHLNDDGTSTFTIAADDPRRVLQIPRESQKLAGLPPNPR